MTARMFKPSWAIVALALLAACSSSRPAAPPTGAEAIAPLAPIAAAPVTPPLAPPPAPLAAAPPEQTPVPPPIAAPPDACGASELAGLVGKPKTDIPVPVDPSRRRVICTTCPAGAVRDPKRLTILFDRATGIVKSVGCG